MWLKSLLMGIGLSNNEADVYLALLEGGETIASGVSEKLDVSRSHVYDSLKRLTTKGLVSYVIRNDRRYFKAADPKKILEYLIEQESKLSENRKAIEDALPRLREPIQNPSDGTYVRVFDGVEGFKTILDDTLEVGGELLVFNSLGENYLKRIPKVVFENYFKERVKRKLRARIFFIEGTTVLPFPLAIYKKIGSGFSLASLFIYGNNVVIFALNPTPVSIKITSSEVARLYCTQFELMWKKTK
ncbi:hypothetical protein HY991_04310 [Candidatus Micrarchaeota archaeon]|nr:hypothetical protein [Candidatus Micrarchaeota archaeon]